MIEKQYIEFIHYEIDGVITPEQKRLLDDYLKSHPEAEKLYRQMIASSKVIENIPEIETPLHLKNRIMNAVNFNRHRYGFKRKGFGLIHWEWVFNPKSRLAFAYVLGICTTLVLLAPFWLFETPDNTLPDLNFYGHIGSKFLDELKPLKQIELNQPDFTGTIGFKQVDQLLIVEFDIKCDNQSELTLGYDPDYLQLVSIRPVQESQKIEYTQSSIKLADSEAMHSLLFFLSTSGDLPRFSLTIVQAGVLLQQQNIES
jgi:hypothetical protein